ncbi:MAG: efflux transporter outer membrane subunit [Acidobacteriaceae bacterium]|nr:efflux transporter outer membrane subunit [Acidobacteriaceae bacterium]
MKSKTRTNRITTGAAFAAALLLCSCNPGPKYVKPPAQAPAAFKEAPPQEYKEGVGWKIAEPGDDRIRGNWWEVYNDPQLNALEEQVKISNQTVVQAEANFRSARTAVSTARANLFPTLTASASYTNSKFSQTARTTSVVPSAAGVTATTGTTTGSGATSTTNGVAGLGTTGVVNTFSLPLDLSYTIDFWHKVRNTIAANTYTAQANAADVATALLTTRAELAQDYFQVRALDAQRVILRDTLENYRRAVELTQTLFRTGLDSEEEVAQAQTQLDTTTAQATDLGVSRAQYEHAIAMLIGKPPAEFSLPVAPFVPRPPAIPLGLPSKLLERRPDIAAAERQVAAANAQIGVARAAYYPNLTLNATGGFETSHFLEWFTWPSRFWSLGPQLAETIFEAGARRAATEQAQAAYDVAVANYRQTVLTVFQSVEDNLAALRILSEEVVEEHTAVNSSNRYLDLSMTRYRAGVDSYLNVITAQNTVLTNRETELQIQLRQMTASVSLIMALGGGWDISELPKVNALTAKQAKWTANGPAQPNAAAVAAPNPPPLTPVAAVPGAPNNPPPNPVPTSAVGENPPK